MEQSDTPDTEHSDDGDTEHSDTPDTEHSDTHDTEHSDTHDTEHSGPVISRDVELDVHLDVAWALIAEPDGWRTWLADDVDIEIEPGSHGAVTDDGTTRRVTIDEVVPGERVSFRWAPTESPERETTVDLVIVERHGTIVIRVVEIAPASMSCSASSDRFAFAA